MGIEWALTTTIVVAVMVTVGVGMAIAEKVMDRRR